MINDLYIYNDILIITVIIILMVLKDAVIKHSDMIVNGLVH